MRARAQPAHKCRISAARIHNAIRNNAAKPRVVGRKTKRQAVPRAHQSGASPLRRRANAAKSRIAAKRSGGGINRIERPDKDHKTAANSVARPIGRARTMRGTLSLPRGGTINDAVSAGKRRTRPVLERKIAPAEP